MRQERAQKHWPCQVDSSNNPEKLNPNLSLLPALLFTCKRMCKTFRGMLHSLPLSFTGNPFHQNKTSFYPLLSLITSPGIPSLTLLEKILNQFSIMRTLFLKVQHRFRLWKYNNQRLESGKQGDPARVGKMKTEIVRPRIRAFVPRRKNCVIQ